MYDSRDSLGVSLIETFVWLSYIGPSTKKGYLPTYTWIKKQLRTVNLFPQEKLKKSAYDLKKKHSNFFGVIRNNNSWWNDCKEQFPIHCKSKETPARGSGWFYKWQTYLPRIVRLGYYKTKVLFHLECNFLVRGRTLYASVCTVTYDWI